MAIRIIVNEKECTSKIVKFGIGVSALIGTIAIGALIVFVLLPIMGVSLAASVGLVLVLSVGIFSAVVAIVLGTAILGTVMLVVDSIVSKFRRG